MEITLTRGIDGKKVGRRIGKASTPEKAWKIIDAFKEAHKQDYKIEPYTRILKIDSRKIAIDFGDYSYFLLIEADLTEKDLDAIDKMFNT